MPHDNLAFAQKTTDSTFAPPTEDTLPVVTTPPLEDTLTFLPPLLVTDIPVVAGLPTDPSSQSRFHFISSVTASATPTYGGDNLSPDGASSSPHSTLSPRFALAADVGAAVTVAGNGRRHFDIGLTLGGQYHQGEVLSTDHTVMQGIDGNQPIITTQTEDTYNAFSLYASLPLSFSIAPRDRQSMGWTLSLTPAHSLVSSHMLAPGGFELNPWRLTLGVGILFPSRFPRRASLVANLLPLYTSQPIHEIGIEIGF